MTFALAIDVGGTKVESALVDERGTLHDGSRFRAPTGRDRSAEELLAAVIEVAGQSLERAPVAGIVSAVGIGSAGPIDREGGRVSPVNLEAWRDFPLRDRVAEATGLPVTLRTDGLCIALAEHWIGAGQGVQDMIGLVVSTGIGGGIISGGRVLAGHSGNAGHLGQLELSAEDENGELGQHANLERLASGPNTVAWARRQGWAGSTGEELAAAYAEGQETAITAVRRAAALLGRGIANAATLLDLELAVIGGGFSNVSPDFLPLVREAVAAHRFDYVSSLRVEASTLSGTGPLVGAAALVHRAEML